MRESFRAILIFLMIAISLLLLTVGLIAPLTPSEGAPKTWELFVFIGIPMFLPCVGIAISKKRSEKAFSVVAELLVILIVVWWARTIGRFLWKNRGDKLSAVQTICMGNRQVR